MRATARLPLFDHEFTFLPQGSFCWALGPDLATTKLSHGDCTMFTQFMRNNSSLNCLRRHHCQFDANDLIINMCDSTNSRSEKRRKTGSRRIFFLHKKSTCVHPSQYWRQARSLFSPNDHHDQHRWWGLATFLYNLLPCLHLDPEFWGTFTGSIFLFLMNHFQVKAALAPTKIWP